MSNLEIVQKSNEFKREYNNNKEFVDKSNHALMVLNQFKTYFELKRNKINTEKKKMFNFSIALLPISILLFLISFPIAIVTLVLSAIGFFRCGFLNYVDKRFVKCLEFFDSHISNATEKQNYYLEKQEYIKSQIVDLEKEIPDEIIKPLTKYTMKAIDQTDEVEISL